LVLISDNLAGVDGLKRGGRTRGRPLLFLFARKDRERVGLVRNALAEMGFEVFWDQETPSGTDWDTWIRGELAKSKCAVVFWSATSIASDNVRHEAVVAKEQRKLISVFLDQLPARDLPMGFYSQQAADLSKWNGDQEDAEWRKFRSEFEAKLMPRWVHQKLNRVDAELEGERARRETAEAHEKTLRAQISKEAKIQQNLKGERDRALAAEERDKALQAQIAKQVETEQVLKSRCESALAEAAKFKTALHERDATLQEQTAKQADSEQGLKTERDRAFAEVAKLTATVEGLRRARPDARPGNPTKRWLSPIAVGIVLLAAIAGAFVLFSPGRKADGEAGAKFAELTAIVTKSDKSRQDAEAKADQATEALTKSDKARQDAEAKATQTAAALAKSEQARQAAEAKAVDAEKARQAAASKADDADKARLGALARAEDADRARRAAEAKVAQAISAQTVAGDQTSHPDLVTDCDRLAASPNDAQRPKSVPGVAFDQININSALVACREAVNKYPDIARFSYQLGRVFDLNKDYLEARKQYEIAAKPGSAVALNNIGVLYTNGYGVPQDYAEAKRWRKSGGCGRPTWVAQHRGPLRQWIGRAAGLCGDEALV
jgi:hypothetical protein